MVNPSLQLRLTQKLTMAPQLQQAIRLLQLNRIELRDHIQELVDANPLLDQEDPAEQALEDPKEVSLESEMAETRKVESDNAERDNDYATDEYEADQWQTDPGQEQWADSTGWSDSFSERQIADTSSASLREHLLAQIRLAHFSDLDAAIATAIVYALDDDGFLIDDIPVIRESLLPELSVEDDEILAVLHRVQRLEPVGVASRNTRECIQLQLQAQPSGTAGVDLALRLTRDFLDLVAANAYEDMLRETRATSEGLKQALELIRGLEPRPGARFDNRMDEYLVPDVYVHLDGSEWVTTLSPESNPSLRLNKYYITLLRKSGGKDADYLRGRLQEARWLLSSLELRNRTLLKVSQCIVDTQQGFLTDGEIAMKPLILKDVADQAGVHESTVSRATTRKYMLTPRGVFELKYFFSSHVRTVSGGMVSATATKARIQVLIENEPSKRPLSDQEISQLLLETGTCVARRTVAKYRESLGVGSSSERRRAYRREVEY
ncbi:MAG: RNA polymerase factor sigma-54 [Gammaproteobacteria bacterium]|nr:RNA polymerase factor sigma-54 [Gammaproteobacteria bacterium]